MPGTVLVRAADQPGDVERLRAFIEGNLAGEAIARLDQHLAHPRYRPAFTQVAEHGGGITGYALLAHERRRAGVASVDAAVLEDVYVSPERRGTGVLRALLYACLSMLVDQQLPLLFGDVPGWFRRFGLAPYRFQPVVQLPPGYDATEFRTDQFTRMVHPPDVEQLDDLAALYDTNYRPVSLSQVRFAPDWRDLFDAWRRRERVFHTLFDRPGRLVAYALVDAAPTGGSVVVEAAVADDGVGYALLQALRRTAGDTGRVALRLSPAHPVTRAALHLGGVLRVNAAPTDGSMDLAGVVGLPTCLRALVPEIDRRLDRSRYASWGGVLQIESSGERTNLAVEHGRAHVVDPARRADVQLSQVTPPALAQLLLGYRTAADLRAAGELTCDDTALGLLDVLFPATL